MLVVRRKMKIFNLIVITLLLIGCSKSAIKSETVAPTNEHPLIKITFIGFNTEKTQGRYATLKVENISEHSILNVRGEVLAYNDSKEQIYAFPWGMGAYPQLVKSNESIEVKWGFEIPDEASTATFKLLEAEIIK
ncbi:hypothetical protein VDG1235_3058 [Verrucomicrobiia bacterium DG1235]|nr:hypothetical protein VDG1235_3058 [Verrucomicrobiae bacterium DG1235]